jgi:hypothetical protein
MRTATHIYLISQLTIKEERLIATANSIDELHDFFDKQIGRRILIELIDNQRSDHFCDKFGFIRVDKVAVNQPYGIIKNPLPNRINKEEVSEYELSSADLILAKKMKAEYRKRKKA